MTGEGIGFSHEEERRMSARALLRAAIFEFGFEKAEEVLEEADAAIARGREGITVLGDYAEDKFGISVLRDTVNIRLMDGPLYTLPRPEAEAFLQELKIEHAHTPEG